MSISLSRWQKAQGYEKKFWQSHQDLIFSKKRLSQLEQYSEIIRRVLRRFIKDEEIKVVLQVGCGPLDIIDFWPLGVKYGLDPLIDFYNQHRQNKRVNVNLINGVGEKLPFTDGYFDLIFLMNAIDHVYDPRQVIAECHRVLRPGRLLYLTLNVFSSPVAAIKKIFDFLGVDKGHPHAFSAEEIKKLITDSGLTVRYEWSPAKASARAAMQASGSAKVRWLGRLGIVVTTLTLVASK